MIVLQLKGGLGNQMFEYACYRSLLRKGKHVRLDNSYFIPNAGIYAIEKFPNVRLKKFKGFRNYPYYLAMGVFRKICRRRQLSYTEDRNLPYDEKVFQLDRGLLTGYFQNEFYFQDIKRQIRKEFQFPYGEERLQNHIRKIENGFYISLHIRRKDYLKLPDIYGGICDEAYYRKAVGIMTDRYPLAKFLVFSDDILWVRENMKLPNAEYVLPNQYENYEDWYDMCLMSHCRHHIIANSTFSWWGAWLNADKNKTVICPKRWDNKSPVHSPACDGWTAV